MKTIFAAAAMLLAGSVFAGDIFVQGHIRQDGTYVPPSHRTTPDNTLSNNYSTQGNINPYTGQQGTVNPYPQQPTYQTPIYQQPQIYLPLPQYNQQTPNHKSTYCPYGQTSC